MESNSASSTIGTVNSPVEGINQSAGVELLEETSNSSILFSDGELVTRSLGRYELIKIIGEGNFGLVYLGFDSELNRKVAIKVPKPRQVSRPEHFKQYLHEARTVASLSHPYIVPVFDFGTTEDGLIYVVSKYIEGETLAQRIKRGRLSFKETADMIGHIAQALSHAHDARLIHRDLKPSNILLEAGQASPYIADFGLAVREKDFGNVDQMAGTPAYMSPEQARGEGHRLDARSDIFSLGVILYELLTGNRPFRGSNRDELLRQVISTDPVPPKAVDPLIPTELERICLRAISKRASDRYPSAAMMAEDLLQNEIDLTLQQSQVEIKPRGLRAYEAEDAGYFLELLPGPRNREGLPNSIQFWKTRIEETDPDKTFKIGLIYGPSGCGKSSLIKAGLLPRLSDSVKAIYIEANAQDTENRILRSLRNSVESCPKNLGLVDTFSYLRRNERNKVVVIIDQFEQWLHASRAEQYSDLVAACRQCDGTTLQVILMIRDDFWMAASRFMSEVEIALVQGVNVAAVDLFSSKHAKKVLTSFGRSFGDLQDVLTAENQEFLDQAIRGLLVSGNVVCVQLAVFSEMMKGKPWTPETLEKIGGAEGVGLNFLEESFCSKGANPRYKRHQIAARGVLSVLIPELESDIKGRMQSHNELLEASGYRNNPREFADLMGILTRDLRLITPIESDGSQSKCSTPYEDTPQWFYQLTHDFLVPSIRGWLTRKKQETRKGRTEIKLTELSAIWNARQDDRHLPSPAEYCSIRINTDKKSWTEPQRKMMAKAASKHGFQLAIVLTGFFVFGGYLIAQRYSTQQQRRSAEVVQIIRGLLQSEISQVPSFIQTLESYDNLAFNDLNRKFQNSPVDSNAKLHAALAILGSDVSVVPFLKDRLLSVNHHQFPLVRDLLAKHKEELIKDYWDIVEASENPGLRFRAACALASYDPNNKRWSDSELGKFLANFLTSVEPSQLSPWANALLPIREALIAPLSDIYRDPQQDSQSRSFATYILSDYLASNPEGLFDLLAESNEKQFEEMFTRLIKFEDKAIELGTRELAKQYSQELPEESKEKIAIRKANACVMLLRLDANDLVWPLLQHTSDPRVRSYIIHWVGSRGCTPAAFMERLDAETDDSIKRALIQCLGELNISAAQRKSLSPKIMEVYRNHQDAGVHSSAEWLLKKWGLFEQLVEIDQSLSSYISYQLPAISRNRNWNVNSQGQTFVVLPPGELMVGSPLSEVGRSENEQNQPFRIDRSFAISSKEVTHGQWRAFSNETPDLIWKSDQNQLKTYILSDDSPMIGMTWYEAAWYCNWLSAKEGIPQDQWCYIPNNSGEYSEGMRAKEYFWELSGYRLPTEVEWEYACRAGTITSRYFGQSDALLSNYAWYQSNGNNRAHPVASLKPNDFGLFDMFGNVYEWCYDPLQEQKLGGEKGLADRPKSNLVRDDERRVLRGGSFFFPSISLRSAARSSLQPDSRPNLTFGGFRPARTLPSEQNPPLGP